MAVPQLWNSLLEWQRQESSLRAFQQACETELFKTAYGGI